jgi:hypothetical protein
MTDTFQKYFLYALPLVVLVVNRIPLVGKYVRVVNTLIHESGHTLFALLFNGEVLSVELFSDTSGTAVTKSKGKFSQFIVALSGYPFASVVSYLMFWFVFNEKYLTVMYVLASFAVINLLMFVKNAYGIYWLITFTALLLFANFYGNETIYFSVSAFLSGILLFESLYSSLQLVGISYKNPKKAGDATNLAKITHIPAIIWSLLFVAQSAFFIYLTVLLFYPVS